MSVSMSRVATADRVRHAGAWPGRLWRAAPALLCCALLCGCFNLGPTQLDADQTGYSRALTTAEKRQTLLNVVRLRYADTPTFLDATQVISGYQLQRSVTGGFELFPSASPSTYLNGGGTLQLQESPTFTFQPVTGDQFAQSFLRPLPPGNLLPLALGGLPVDVLFRLGVQSINGMSNATSLAGRHDAGSPQFFDLLHDLRVLQIAGLLNIQFEHSAKATDEKDKGSGRIFLSFAPSHDPDLVPVVRDAKRLLDLPRQTTKAEVVYGRTPNRPGQVAILTRSMLGVLGQLAFQVEVPAADIARGRTMRTVGEIGREHKPAVVIHSGRSAPADAFTDIEYDHEWFWIADDDFDSKLAFTMLQILLALAKTSSTPGTLITIPAG